LFNNCRTAVSPWPVRHTAAGILRGPRARARATPSPESPPVPKEPRVMQRLPMGLVLLSAAGMLGAAALAETKVEVKDVHLCCGACVKGVGKALKGVDGVKGVCDRDAKTVTITATNETTAQKAIDALAAAGFHGRPDTKAVRFPRDSGATKGKVTSLTLT